MASAPYFPLQVAANLRFNDQNGNPVTQLYPTAETAQLDNPSTGYISHIGSRLSSLIDQYNDVNTILVSYNTRISALEVSVANILASGTTSLPYINGGCLNGSLSQPIATVVTELVASECSYITALGTTSALSSGVVAMDTSVLNALPAYSQNSVMSGLAGWIAVPATVGAWMNNISLAYLDMRVGVNQALSQSAITCASVDIIMDGDYNSSNRNVNLYFPGSLLPSNFSENGSIVTVEDNAGHTFSQNINIRTVITNGYLNLDISASTLQQNSPYVVKLTYNVTSTSPSLGCSNTLILDIPNNTSVCPNISTTVTASTVTFIMQPLITSNVTYTVDLLGTSGSTVLQTKTYTNPSIPVTDSFTGLTAATNYRVRVTVTIGTTNTVCSIITQTTSSS